MNFNNYPVELKKEEQMILDRFVERINLELKEIEKRRQGYIQKAENANVSLNSDQYGERLEANKGQEKAIEDRKEILKARKGLYGIRILWKYVNADSSGIEEIKVGYHKCVYKGECFVHSWIEPEWRPVFLNDALREHEYTNPNGYRTHYTILAKEKLELRVSRVTEATNLIPGDINEKTMKLMRDSHFFSDGFLDEMMKHFTPEDYNSEAAAKIIYDEFLKELVKRRSETEFRDIIFSIQKKQGEIIQAPQQKNMVVQGCAGSGKSMIMLHRLPILMYDNPNQFNRTNIYVISPSTMYIQQVEKVRDQLEISDVDMGTAKQYYDHCISKYLGHKPSEYGSINGESKISTEAERYVYSKECVKDIVDCFEHMHPKNEVPLDRAYSVLKIRNVPSSRENATYAQKISNRLHVLQDVLDANNKVLEQYSVHIRDVYTELNNIESDLKHYKEKILGDIEKNKNKKKGEIEKTSKELKRLDDEKNALAIQNRKNIIAASTRRIEELERQKKAVEADDEYFGMLSGIGSMLKKIISPFERIKGRYNPQKARSVYEAVDKAKQLIDVFHWVAWGISHTEDKYTHLDSINRECSTAEERIAELQKMTAQYLEFDYYSQIVGERDLLTSIDAGAITDVYETVMGKIGIHRMKNGNLTAVECSPYLYLQILYQFQGAPLSGDEALLAIDEAQNMAPEEIQLIKNVNHGRTALNLYGDVYQHVEGTKGIDNWNEFKKILDFDLYEMQENYRNASQITDYCNQRFGMQMRAINTPGRGVHEIGSDKEFQEEMITRLLGAKKAGLSAILVTNKSEAKYLLGRFSKYAQNLHDMTDENVTIERTGWNIIPIDDAKGLEFNSVIALAGRMTKNQKYIAYTRALDELYVYDQLLDTSKYENRPQ